MSLHVIEPHPGSGTYEETRRRIDQAIKRLEEELARFMDREGMKKAYIANVEPKDFPDRFEGARTYEINISVTVTLDPAGLPEEGTHAFKLVLAENLREILQDLSYQDLETLAGTYINSYRLIDERWEELKTTEAGDEQFGLDGAFGDTVS